MYRDRLLWSVACCLAIPIVFLFGLPQTWEYWIVTALALLSATLVLWEYSAVKSKKDTNADIHQKSSVSGTDDVIS
jgi:hypothetical protein